MKIFPAIDLKNGECVRLFQGDYDTAHRVSDDYLETAETFANSGVEWIHMIDLDGAKDAKRKNQDIIFDVAKNTKLKVQTGGGIRTLDDIKQCFENNISRVIIGSAAVKNPEIVKDAVRIFGDKIAVGIDARNGIVATEGWLENSGINYIDLALQMCENGVKYYVFTDIAKDGMLTGPNFEMTYLLQKKVNVYGAKVIASGGIKTIDDIKKLHENDVYGAICGKSIYSGTLDLREAVEVAK
ncbi:MAG: 1-(5-phosphoribosyl)-5-[(5-phosphoribosylamino)methylideneamino]imidazole-4-carboxamide isomerase [Oscillospiraceae bacterium]|nr:1-(5-phosphoribosyl)-5-[(5-phosphoribosylamino)methylideneamino]imidazole-4-carboxamide isomerase [Oscillospiraceae bacterium]